jgi:hypothetical protein
MSEAKKHGLTETKTKTKSRHLLQDHPVIACCWDDYKCGAVATHGRSGVYLCSQHYTRRWPVVSK